MACSGAFGVPDTTRTCDPGLRRLVLYPTELLGHISKIFNFPPPTDSNELPLRRRTLYPGEVRGHIQKLFNFSRLRDSNGSIVRRRSLYTTELRGYMGIRPMVPADGYRIILSGSGLSVNGGNDRSGPGGCRTTIDIGQKNKKG